jgi:hypothetical protein
MKVLIFASVVAVACGMGLGEGEEKGVCLDPKMMAAMCTYNSAIGDKMTEAHDACEVESRRRQGRPGPGKGGKGYNGKGKENKEEEETCGIDFEKISGFFSDVWEAKACVLRQVGWLDADDSLNLGQLEEDLSSLPAALSAGLADTQELCMNRTSEVTLEGLFSSEEFGASSEMDRHSEPDCKPQVNPEQLMGIEMNLQKLAFFRCVHENFMDGCGNYILETAGQMMMEQGVAASTPAPALV